MSLKKTTWIESRQRAVQQDIQKLENTCKQLMKASFDSQALDLARERDGKAKMLTQGLSPLAFRTARDMKSLVANMEGFTLLLSTCNKYIRYVACIARRLLTWRDIEDNGPNV